MFLDASCVPLGACSPGKHLRLSRLELHLCDKIFGNAVRLSTSRQEVMAAVGHER